MNFPLPPEAIGNYVTYKKAGNLIFTSGHVPITGNKNLLVKFQVKFLDTAYKAASALCAELTISTLEI
jgi:enamine deaminase RidA (YjgF/YER057c/UK114 family)